MFKWFYIERRWKKIPTHLETIVCPATEFHEAGLLIEWEISHINFAGWFENSWRRPIHFACVVKNGLRQCCHNVFSVSAVLHKKPFAFTAAFAQVEIEWKWNKTTNKYIIHFDWFNRLDLNQSSIHPPFMVTNLLKCNFHEYLDTKCPLAD